MVAVPVGMIPKLQYQLHESQLLQRLPADHVEAKVPKNQPKRCFHPQVPANASQRACHTTEESESPNQYRLDRSSTATRCSVLRPLKVVCKSPSVARGWHWALPVARLLEASCLVKLHQQQAQL